MVFDLGLDGLYAFSYQLFATLHQLTAASYLQLCLLGFRGHVFLVEDIDDTLDVALFKHFDSKTLALAHGAMAANRLVDQKSHIQQLLLHVHHLLMAFLPVYDLLSEQVVRIVYSQSTQLGDVFVELGVFLLQTAVLMIGCRKRQIGIVSYLDALQRDFALFHLQLAAVACSQPHVRYEPLKLHDKMEIHAVFTGIVAPIMANALEEFVLERLEFVGFDLPIYKSAYINEGLGMTVIGSVFIQSLFKLLDGILSSLFMEHTDAHIARAYGLIVDILRPFTCAISGEVLPSAAFDADTPWLVYVVKFGYQSLETVAVVIQLIARGKKNGNSLHVSIPV